MPARAAIGQPEADLVIRNGLLLDGSGSPAAPGDILVRDGQIVAIVTGGLRRARARSEVDAAGRYVVPGFIALSPLAPTAEGASDPALTARALAAGITTQTVVGAPGATPQATETARPSLNQVPFVSLAELRVESGVDRTSMPTTAAVMAFDELLSTTLAQRFGATLADAEAAHPHPPAELELRALARSAGQRGRVLIGPLEPIGPPTDNAVALLEQRVRLGNHARIHLTHLERLGDDTTENWLTVLRGFDYALHTRVPITASLALPPDASVADHSGSGLVATPATSATGSSPMPAELLERLLLHPSIAIDPGPVLNGNLAAWLGTQSRPGAVPGLPTIIRKLTALPAEILGLPDRGRLAPGQAADLVLLARTGQGKASDPAVAAAPSERLFVERTFVNGALAWSAAAGGQASSGHGRYLEPPVVVSEAPTAELAPGTPLLDADGGNDL